MIILGRLGNNEPLLSAKRRSDAYVSVGTQWSLHHIVDCCFSVEIHIR